MSLQCFDFSGGIGEHDAQLRQDVCTALNWLGLDIDAGLNAQAVGDQVLAIHAPTSRIEVWVIPTDEGFVAASEAASLLL
jgi:acetate kinase